MFSVCRVRRAGRTWPSAFTLVELLVVIGIIALLISILLPSLAKARQAALLTQCLSNERQIGIYMNIYANEYHGYLPPQSAYFIRGMSVEAHDAFNRIAKGSGGLCFYCPTLEPVSRYLFNASGFNLAALNWSPAEHWATPACAGAHVLGYFYLGNPTATANPDVYWVDTNKNGTSRDEYVVKFSERGASNIAILTDVVNQVIGLKKENWYLRHPADKIKKNGGSNVLYGDGHAAFVPRDDMKIRWYLPNAVGW